MALGLMFIGYLLAGAVTALVAGKLAWGHPDTKKMLREQGYEKARSVVVKDQALVFMLWPMAILVEVFHIAKDALIDASDPHIKHRKTYAKRAQSYRKLKALEVHMPASDRTATRPERFCECLPDAPARSDSDIKIQRRLELVINRMEALDVDAALNDVHLQNLNVVKDELRNRGMWV